MSNIIGLINYGIAGNIHSIKKAIEKAGGTVKIINHVEDLERVNKIVIPGVGSFKDAMHQKELFARTQLKRPDVVELSLALDLPMCVNSEEWNQVWKNLKSME